MKNDKFNFPYLKAAESAVRQCTKCDHFTQDQKDRLARKVHDIMIESEDFPGGLGGQAIKLVNEYATSFYGKNQKWTDKGLYEREGSQEDGFIKPRVPIEQMIHPDFRGPACYRYEKQIPEIRTRRAENERLAKEGKSRATEDAPYKSMLLEEMLAAMVVTNKEIAKLPEYQDWLHEKAAFKRK